MTKYILTSGKAVITNYQEVEDRFEYIVSNVNTPMTFNTFGEAIIVAVKVNNCLEYPSFKIRSYEQQGEISLD